MSWRARGCLLPGRLDPERQQPGGSARLLQWGVRMKFWSFSGSSGDGLLYPAKEPVEVKHEHELLLTQARHGAHEVRTTP